MAQRQDRAASLGPRLISRLDIHVPPAVRWSRGVFVGVCMVVAGSWLWWRLRMAECLACEGRSFVFGERSFDHKSGYDEEGNMKLQECKRS